jgi:release factor glutamine methyltransferase
MLLLHALGRAPADRAWLLAHDQDALAPAAADRFARFCQRRAAGEPLAYITGWHEFFGLALAVDARVLDPRPDTETLVEWVLALPLPAQARVLDLGTGSGAIALALQAQRPSWQVSASDASADALAVARANAARLGLPIAFREGDWLAPWASERFDLVVSNPPYIADADPHLAALTHEPLAALASGPDGLDAIRRIAMDAPAHLLPGGWLLIEHGWDQATRVRALLAAAGLDTPASHRDIAGIERCSGAQFHALG